jgi:hypothetical protein
MAMLSATDQKPQSDKLRAYIEESKDDLNLDFRKLSAHTTTKKRKKKRKTSPFDAFTEEKPVKNTFELNTEIFDGWRDSRFSVNSVIDEHTMWKYKQTLNCRETVYAEVGRLSDQKIDEQWICSSASTAADDDPL